MTVRCAFGGSCIRRHRPTCGVRVRCRQSDTASSCKWTQVSSDGKTSVARHPPPLTRTKMDSQTYRRCGKGFVVAVPSGEPSGYAADSEQKRRNTAADEGMCNSRGRFGFLCVLLSGPKGFPRAVSVVMLLDATLPLCIAGIIGAEANADRDDDWWHVSAEAAACVESRARLRAHHQVARVGTRTDRGPHVVSRKNSSPVAPEAS